MSVSDLPAPVFFVLVFVAVLAVIGVITWFVRRFGAERFGATAARNRQPRLAVIDAASVDGRRRLVIIRRDNVEHLLMIGGPTDVVVETNIVRGNAAATARDVGARPRRCRPGNLAAAGPARRGRPMAVAAAARTRPAPASHADRGRRRSLVGATRAAGAPDSACPLKMPRTGRCSRKSSPARAPSERPARSPAWRRNFRARRCPSLRRRSRVLRPKQPVRRRRQWRRLPTPWPAIRISAEMANRLESALRRPVAVGDSRLPVTPKPPAAVDASARIAPDLRARREPEPTQAPAADLKAERAEPMRDAAAEGKPAAEVKGARAEPKLGRTESKFGQPKPAAPKTLYDSLEQEMASLLGRPAGKA